jgi:hypothetical protein
MKDATGWIPVDGEAAGGVAELGHERGGTYTVPCGIADSDQESTGRQGGASNQSPATCAPAGR